MKTLSFEKSIEEFLQMGRDLQGSMPVTGEHVLKIFTAWYRDNRIENAVVDDDGDMVLLQWGGSSLYMHSEVIDFRKLNGADFDFPIQELQYLNYTRQVFAPAAGDNEEFDDSAIHMSIDLGFGASDGKEPNYNDWIESPDDIDRGEKVFSEDLFVQSLIRLPAKTIGVSVSYCG